MNARVRCLAIAFLIGIAIVLWAAPRASAGDAIRDLGVLPGDTVSGAADINDKGQVVGRSINPGDWSHAFLWANGTMTDLGNLGGIPASAEAAGINNAGQIVGWSINGSNYHRAFLWENGTMKDLGVGDSWSQATAINGVGQVVGYYVTAGVYHAFLWQDGLTTDLSNLSGLPWSRATAINARGQVVGWSESGDGYYMHAFLWENGTMTDLGTLSGMLQSSAYGINDAGQIAGWSGGYDHYPNRGVRWDHGPAQDLGSLADNYTLAQGINNAGQIVGGSGGRGFLWENGIMIGLGSLLRSPFYGASGASAINEAGVVVGSSSNSDPGQGGYRAVLWTTTYHNVAITQGSASPRTADVGIPLTITATVENQAARPESFNVTSYAGSIVVGTRAVNLDALSSSTVLFSWDTTGVSPGSYDIRIETSAVPHDANLTDNTYSAGSVLLSTPVGADTSATTVATDVGLSVALTCRAIDGTPPYSYSWDFGDRAFALGETASHAYGSPGTKKATCTVADGSGNQANSSQLIEVSSLPTVTFSVDPDNGHAGSAITFNASATGGSGVLAYAWNFGDRSGGVGATVTHAYASPGQYTASVIVLDSAGGTGSSSESVTVSKATLSPLVVTATTSMVSAVTGDEIGFTASASGGAGGPYTFSWDFGDGTRANGPTVTHSYANPGSFTPKVTVVDGSGSSQQTLLPTIVVRSSSDVNPPAASATSPTLLVFGAGAAIVLALSVGIVLVLLRRKSREP